MTYLQIEKKHIIDNFYVKDTTRILSKYAGSGKDIRVVILMSVRDYDYDEC